MLSFSFSIGALGQQGYSDLLDTTISLPNIEPSKTTLKSKLNEQMAQAILLEYYKKKGICDASNPKEMPIATESIMYDTLYFANLNHDSFPDAIILYWITPVYASGHCYQPTEAMIVSESNGYRLVNADFLPDDFQIDSIASDKNRTFIYGCEYDCRDNIKMRKFKASITAFK